MYIPSNEDLSERAKYGSLYYTIPSAVYDDDRLSGDEILFYVLISNLANKFGYCYASDEWFANKRKVDDRTVRRWLERLEELKYIKRVTQKVGMKWDRKIYILIVHPQTESNNTYERTLETASNGHTSGQKCPDREVKNVRIIEKDLNIITTTTSTPPSAPFPLKEEKRKKLMLKFGDSLTTKIFDDSWAELQTIDPTTITSVDGLLSSIIEKRLICSEMPQKSTINVKEREDRIAKHLAQAKANEGEFGEYKIKASDAAVFFAKGYAVSPVGYDCDDETWKRNTAGWFKSGD